MAVREPQITLDDFIRLVFREGNVNRMFELISGEIVEVLPSRSGHSEVAASIIFEIKLFCREKGFARSCDGRSWHLRHAG